MKWPEMTLVFPTLPASPNILFQSAYPGKLMLKRSFFSFMCVATLPLQLEQKGSIIIILFIEAHYAIGFLWRLFSPWNVSVGHRQTSGKARMERSKTGKLAYSPPKQDNHYQWAYFSLLFLVEKGAKTQEWKPLALVVFRYCRGIPDTCDTEVNNCSWKFPLHR